MLRNENFTNNTNENKSTTKSSPRSYQKKAIDDVLEGLETSDRGKLIMACRTGKTPTSIFIGEAMFHKGFQGVRLFVAPSLLLLKQTKDDYLKLSNLRLKFGIICSDGTVGKTEDLDISVEELGETSLGVAKDNESIKELLRTKELTHVFCTYKSLPKLAKVLKLKEFKEFSFDLGFADEAHRTATKMDSYLSTFHEEKKIRIKKRIYMTATPRVYMGRYIRVIGSKKRFTYCMDMDEDTYGSDLHVLSFKKAIEDKIIRDFRIHISTLSVNAKKLSKVLSWSSAIKFKKYLLNGDIVSAVEATERAVVKYKIRKAFVFFSNINRSKAFVEAYKALYPSRIVDEISSRDGSNERSTKLKNFKTGDTQILANARLLTEGITVGDGDLVVLADKKDSEVDIAQAISRVLNKSKRKFGHILLPANIPNDCDVEESLRNGDFDTIVRTLRTMQTIYGPLNSEILKISKGNSKKGVSSPPRNKELDQAGKIVFEYIEGEIDKSLQLKFIKKTFHRSAIRKHTYESIMSDAKMFNRRVDFQKAKSSAYHTAINMGILDEVCKHMIPPRKEWTLETLHEEAKKFNYRGDFKKNSPSAYAIASRRGFMDKICGHMGKKLKEWTPEDIFAEARKYNKINDFHKNSNSAYDAAKRQGIYDKVVEIITGSKNPSSFDKKDLKESAKKYNSKTAFLKGDPDAYEAARLLGILDELFK